MSEPDHSFGKSVADAGVGHTSVEGQQALDDLARRRRNRGCLLPKEYSFSIAVEVMKAGAKVARRGWNGTRSGGDMWVCLGRGVAALQADKFWNKHTREFAEKNGGFAEVLPYFIMKTADDKILMGWLASQSDMVAEDWFTV